MFDVCCMFVIRGILLVSIVFNIFCLVEGFFLLFFLLFFLVDFWFFNLLISVFIDIVWEFLFFLFKWIISVICFLFMLLKLLDKLIIEVRFVKIFLLLFGMIRFWVILFLCV